MKEIMDDVGARTNGEGASMEHATMDCDVSSTSNTSATSQEFNLLYFPVEVLLRQLSFLTERDLFSVARTCKLMNQLSRSNSLWMSICLERWKVWDDKRVESIRNASEDGGWRFEYDRRRKIDKETFRAIKSIISPSLTEKICSKREIVEALICPFPRKAPTQEDTITINDTLTLNNCHYLERSEIVNKLTNHDNIGINYWAEKIKQIVHENSLLEEWVNILNKEPEADYEEGAILIARWVYPEVTAEDIKSQLDELAKGLGERMCKEEGADWKQTLTDKKMIYALNRYFFDKLGFKGNADYYSPANSYINSVLETRLGIPITLCLVYVAVSKRVGVNIDMMNVPGHFMVRYIDPTTNNLFIIDPFNQGRITREDAAGEAAAEIRRAKSATIREVWTRMLYNLLRLSNDQPIDMMIYLVRQMVVIDPTEPNVSTLSGLLLHLEKNRMAYDVATTFFPPEHPTRIGILRKCEQVLRIKTERKSREKCKSTTTTTTTTPVTITAPISSASPSSFLTASTPTLGSEMDSTTAPRSMSVPTRLSNSMPALPSFFPAPHATLLLGDVVTADDPFAGIICRKWGTDFKVLFPRALSRIVKESMLQRNDYLEIENSVTVGRYFIGQVNAKRYRPNLRLIRLHPDVVTPEDRAFAIELDHRLTEEINEL
eukprot:TRINITY_DN2969_c0_g2_i1.p1 TRINITY_DN2969_c0_g2~~TRINITY_DN2969_c0_g2_i1.p1  ORF type:complete len:661 (-),score=136.71 TRINITY_DN2969_c0_g2_i1:143-2125(-)